MAILSGKPDPKSTTAAKAVVQRLQDLTAKELAQRAFERRAIEAIAWAMPAVNFELMYQAMVREMKGRFNQVVYWSRLPDWKNQTLTPNPDVIYLMPFFDTKDGPIVIEIPSADNGVINGTIMDSWQAPLEDVGPAGADNGKGGKYLIVPPDYTKRLPPGYIVLPSGTHQGYALLRSLPKSGSDADVAGAAAYGRRIKLYPLADAANPPETVFRDAADVVYDATIPYDWRFFQALDRFVERELWLTRDKVMIDPLRSLGIEKGKSFNPDDATKLILNDAAAEAHALLEMRYEALFSPYFDNSRWAMPASPEYLKNAPTSFADPDSYPVDDRGALFSFAFFTPKHLGQGQFYLMTITDKDGEAFHGGDNYRLTVPPNVPVHQYWSATAYDRTTHALIRGLSRSGRSSQSPGLLKNGDGSVELYFGPRAPIGKDSNWVPTSASGIFEVLFRFYGPGKALVDKTWSLPDIEKLK
jgi:hypothetical protein